MEPKLSLSNARLKARLYLVALAVFALGLCSALLIYVTADEVPPRMEAPLERRKPACDPIAWFPPCARIVNAPVPVTKTDAPFKSTPVKPPLVLVASFALRKSAPSTVEMLAKLPIT